MTQNEAESWQIVCFCLFLLRIISSKGSFSKIFNVKCVFSIAFLLL